MVMKGASRDVSVTIEMAVVGRDERPRSSAMRLDGGWGMVVEDG